MNNKLFIGNLSYNATENDLRDFFSQSGTVVSVNIIKDRLTDRSKGFAFIEMSTEKEASLAIEKLHNSQMGERSIIVAKAKPMEKRESNRNFSGGNRNSFHKRDGGRDKNRKRGYHR